MEITRFGKMVRVALLAATLAAVLAAGGAAPARAAFVCAQVLEDVTIKDSLTVPADAECTLLDAVVVRGSVTVEAGAFFTAFDSEIRGSIVATGHAALDLRTVEVRGSVAATGGSDTSSLLGVRTRGDVVLSNNVGGAIQVVGSDVRGNMTISGNTEDSGEAILLRDNTIAINLNCDGNSPALELLGNVVGGVASGQCAVS